MNTCGPSHLTYFNMGRNSTLIIKFHVNAASFTIKNINTVSRRANNDKGY